MLLIRSIGPLDGLTATQQARLSDLIASLSDIDDLDPPVADWLVRG